MSRMLIETTSLAQTIEFTEDELVVALVDGRKIIAPLVWFPRLLRATPEQRNDWELIGDGEGVHWPQMDEDLSVEGLLAGRRSRSI